jgi:hypothetical protein
MKLTFWNTGAALAATIALAACSGSPQSPTSPSAAIGGDTTAAADGSTLKVTAPSLLSPINGARVDTIRPLLSWTASTGNYVGAAPTYDVEVSAGGAVVYTASVPGTEHQPTADTAVDTAYTWRVRARQDGATGPWSAAGSFQSALPGSGVLTGFRTPDPAPGTRLGLPNESGLVNDEYNRNFNDWQNSCQDRQGDRAWVWLDKLIDRLRTKDLRWGYNGKRGNTNDTSQDIVDYHYGAGDSNGSTQVYIMDVMFGHCGGSPSPAWIDQTAVTVNSGTIGRFIYPRVGRRVGATAGSEQ